MTIPSTQHPLIEKVRNLLPLIEQTSSEAERLGHLPDRVLNALFELRLFRLFIPAEYNGEPTDLPTALRIFELIASADGATGWLVMIGAGGGLFSGFIEERAARGIFAPERAVIAGSGSPSGLAITKKNGFEVSGRWAYASGAHHATWFTANCKIDGNDEQIISIAMPAEQVEIHDTWHVFGMQATGSHDFTAEPVFVPENCTFSLADKPLLKDPIFHCPLETLASLTFASVAVGIAQHAFDEFQRFIESKPLVGDIDIQQRIKQANELISQGRQQLYQLAEAVWNEAENAKAPRETLRRQVDEDCREIVQNGVTAADLLKARAGMLAAFTDSAFGRAWRDLHTLSQHIIVSPAST
ncbi:hypothetical protein [Thiomicrorhabdus sp.]|uniref:hypothetical protein n=1 Tax=Thiomicrorhabdus sp. TaxID=2039724 RepID=UPI0029C97A4A|nr:hypothetical protein [Thiomicrorhabdus sp.]